jgi:hypothetical protein
MKLGLQEIKLFRTCEVMLISKVSNPGLCQSWQKRGISLLWTDHVHRWTPSFLMTKQDDCVDQLRGDQSSSALSTVVITDPSDLYLMLLALLILMLLLLVI